MATTETLETTPTSFENCLSCGAQMAEDQRYCLNCGVRRGETRLPFAQVMAASERPATAPVSPPPRDPGQPPALAITWPVAAGGAAVLVLALGVGVLIGHGTAGNPKVASATPQVITVGSGSGGGAAPASNSSTFRSDWPSGKSGWTVQLQSLSKGSAQPADLAAAKTAAAGKGAKNVGALASDDFSSLSPGLYVIYSGDYKSKKEAQSALGGLKKNFPNATVVQVSNSSSSGGSGSSGRTSKGSTSKQSLQNLQNLSPQDYQKQSQKLPDKITTPGGKAPIDKSKPVGGGSGSQTIQ